MPDARRPFPMLAAHTAGAARPPRRPDIAIHHLTIDAACRAALESLAAERAEALSGSVSVAIIVADHRTGEILASVGSSGLFDEARDGFIDMTRAVRSPGSTLKPLIYGLAFEQGVAHPETLIEDGPVDFAGYDPENFDREFHGTVTMRRALQLSLNVPAIQLLEAVGPARLVARMRRAGATPVLSDISPPGLAVGLGGVGVTLTDLVAIHAAIGRGGQAVPLTLRGRPAACARPRRSRCSTRAPPGTSPRSSPARRGRTMSRPALSPSRPAPPTAIATPGRSASTAATSSASGSAARTARRCRA